jgi:hypothetical protein
MTSGHVPSGPGRAGFSQAQRFISVATRRPTDACSLGDNRERAQSLQHTQIAIHRSCCLFHWRDWSKYAVETLHAGRGVALRACAKLHTGRLVGPARGRTSASPSAHVRNIRQRLGRLISAGHTAYTRFGDRGLHAHAVARLMFRST